MKKLFFIFILIFFLGCTQIKEDCSDSGPVCALVEIQCITAPCDPIQQTFKSECEALKVNTKHIIEGPCETITNFIECERAGYPVMESYPRQCRDPIQDKTFTEII